MFESHSYIHILLQESVRLSCEIEMLDAKFSQSLNLIYNKTRDVKLEDTGKYLQG